MNTLCDEDSLTGLARDLQSASGDRIARIDTVLARFPEDPRLHFLRGSVLIEDGRLIEAHDALSRAVALAPDFAIARFQLGLFQLTSSEADAALETWARLDRLPDGHYLRKFVDGLRCLIRDDFAGAVAHLSEGIRLNQENAPLNRDMHLVIEKCQTLANAGSPEDDGAAVSQTSLILQHFTNKGPLN